MLDSLRKFVLAVFLLASASVQAELVPVGFAEYSELADNLFITALSTESGELQRDGVKRLEFKFLRNKLSYRRFVRLLMQNVVINNTKEQVQHLSEEMVQLESILKTPFLKGDHLIFEQKEERVFSISLNSIKIGNIQSKELFDVVLRAWVGDVPPSRVFKESLLGRVDYTDVAAEFAKLDFDAARPAAIKTWLASRAPEPTIIVNTKQVTQVITPIIKTESGPSQVEREAAVQALRIEKGKAEERARIARLEAEKKALEQKLAEEKVLKQKLAIELKAKKKREKRQSYASMLASHAKQNIIYPRRSQQLKHTGNVMAQVTIDRYGSLVEMEFVEEAKFELLNRAVKRAVKKSQPFPRIPLELDEEFFIFQVPVTFSLSS